MSLLQQTARSSAWSVLSAQSTAALTLVSSIVIARLVVPNELGRYALATVITGLAASVATLYTGNFYVVSSTPSERLLRTALALELIAGFVVWLGVATAGIVYMLISSHDNTAQLVILAAASLPLNAFGSPVGPLAAVFARELNYRVPTLCWIACFVISVTLKVFLVVAGFGAWGLVAGDVALPALFGIAMLTFVPAGRGLTLNRDLVRPVLSWGLPSLVTGFFMFVSERTSEFAVAIVLGTRELGLYYLAARLPQQLYALGGSLSIAFLPAFSRSDDRQLERGFLLATRLSGFLIGLPLAIAVPLAEPFITTVYGQVWKPASGAFLLLMATIAVRFVFWHYANLLKSRGRVREIALLTGAQAVVVVPATIVGAALGGLEGAAGAALAVELVVIWPKIRLIRSITRFNLVAALRPPATTFVVGTLTCMGFAAVFAGADALVIGALAVTPLFLATAWWVDPKSFAAIGAAFKPGPPRSNDSVTGSAEEPPSA